MTEEKFNLPQQKTPEPKPELAQQKRIWKKGQTQIENPEKIGEEEPTQPTTPKPKSQRKRVEKMIQGGQFGNIPEPKAEKIVEDEPSTPQPSEKTNNPTMEDIDNFNVLRLRNMAKGMKIKRFSIMNKNQLKEAIKEKLKDGGTVSKAEGKKVVEFRYPKRLRKSPQKRTPLKSVIKNLDNFML